MSEDGLENLSGRAEVKERREIIKARIEGYEDWQKTLERQVQEGKITVDEERKKIGRAMVARELLAERYKGRAYRDPLTNLPNRRAFEEKYRSAINKNAPFGLLIVDIDHFKKVNDEYGHLAGDKVLIQTGLTLASNLREVRNEENFDVVARFGGEEFAILLPGLQKDSDLESVAERLRLSLSENPLSITVGKEGKIIPITISLGGGVYQEEGAEQFFRRVDKEALYQAKEQGRNKAVILPSVNTHG